MPSFVVGNGYNRGDSAITMSSWRHCTCCKLSSQIRDVEVISQIYDSKSSKFHSPCFLGNYQMSLVTHSTHNLRILTAKSFASGGRSCIIRSDGKWRNLVTNLCVFYQRVMKFHFWDHGNLALWDQRSRNGNCVEVILKVTPKKNRYRERSLISIVVNCCQISIVPRVRYEESLHCIYRIFHSIDIIITLLFYFIFHKNGMPI